jgi:DNA-binding XRE family transcriptional regulator
VHIYQLIYINIIGIFKPINVDLYYNRRYYAYMQDFMFSSPEELQVALGERIRRLRLSRNMDQRATAGKAGLSEKALRNLETGQGSTVETLLRTLKALDYLQGLEMLAPEVTVDPLALLHSSKPQQRVRRSRQPRKAEG